MLKDFIFGHQSEVRKMSLFSLLFRNCYGYFYFWLYYAQWNTNLKWLQINDPTKPGKVEGFLCKTFFFHLVPCPL